MIDPHGLMHSDRAPEAGTTSGAVDTVADAPMQFAEVNDLIQQIVKSARAHQIYDVANPVYQRFLSNLTESFSGLWERISALHLELSDEAMSWQGQRIVPGEGRENLAFLFFRDGVRSLTFLPGFEDEVPAFLDVLHRGRQGSRDSEDLITLLWDADFQTFRYGYVDQLAQGLELPEGQGGGTTAGVPYEELNVDLSLPPAEETTGEAATVEDAPPAAMGATAPLTPMDGIVRPGDFQETLYFLDEPEMAALQAEVRKEMKRDVKTDVLNALFDRLEEGPEVRQAEVLDVLRQLLPSLLSRGDMQTASRLLVELKTLIADGGLPESMSAKSTALFDELSSEEPLQQLVRALEDGVLQPGTDELGVFFMHLRPSALPLLLAATWNARVPELRARMEAALDAVGRTHPEDVLRMLEAAEPDVAAAAAALSARLGLEPSTPALGRLMQRQEPEVRLAAVEAAISLHTGQSMAAAQAGLDDGDREVRMAAARGLAKYRFQPARPRVEQVLRDRIAKESDRTERVLFFEAYAHIGGPDAVGYLDSVLNSRGLMGPKFSPELRACAARALGLITTPAAKEALGKAGADKDVVVRTEVSRALRQELTKS